MQIDAVACLVEDRQQDGSRGHDGRGAFGSGTALGDCPADRGPGRYGCYSGDALRIDRCSGDQRRGYSDISGFSLSEYIGASVLSHWECKPGSREHEPDGFQRLQSWFGGVALQSEFRSSCLQRGCCDNRAHARSRSLRVGAWIGECDDCPTQFSNYSTRNVGIRRRG